MWFSLISWKALKFTSANFSKIQVQLYSRYNIFSKLTKGGGGETYYRCGSRILMWMLKVHGSRDIRGVFLNFASWKCHFAMYTYCLQKSGIKGGCQSKKSGEFLRTLKWSNFKLFTKSLGIQLTQWPQLIDFSSILSQTFATDLQRKTLS